MENSILNKTITMCERVNMPGKVAAVNLLSVLKTDKYKALANTCNGLETKEERRSFKLKNVPVITVGGLFNNYRSEVNLLKHSGLICLDLDGVEEIISLKEKIIKLPFIGYCGCSISGTGLFVIIPIPVSTPKEHFNRYTALEMYFIKSFGIIGTVDPQPKNIAAARFVSFDPDAYFNHTAIIYDELSKPVIHQKAMPVVRQYRANTDDEKVWAMVELIQERRLDFAPDYNDYLRTAFSLANGLGESGRQSFHAVCQYSTLYNFIDAEKKYSEALKSKNGNVSLATFFGYCKDFGLMPEKKLLNTLPVYVPKQIERSYPKEWDNPQPDFSDRWQLLNNLINEGNNDAQLHLSGNITDAEFMARQMEIEKKLTNAGIELDDYVMAFKNS